jgi:eukaryotic-like serine/threonine-protein kinase
MTDEQAQPPGDALVGHTLADRYRLTRKIGEGGMGAVYEAQHILLSKPVAVKVLRDKYLDRPEVARRLVQEARLASSIRHEHIVDITDSGSTEDGRTFVVMEHLDGLSLAELLKREGALPEARVIDIARQAASALGAAHARGIVHRDVKPENIFLVERGGRDFVKVLDFGISKSVRPGGVTEESLRLTHTGMIMGTPLYMSPEQARGDEDVDHRIDVYALGVILYECLTGEVPFRATNYLGVIAAVVTQEVTPPRALRPEMRISEAMERVVQRAMAKSRDDRYATMAALAADLERVAAGDAVEPLKLTPPARERPPRTTLWLAAVGVLAGAGAVGDAGAAGVDRRGAVAARAAAGTEHGGAARGDDAAGRGDSAGRARVRRGAARHPAAAVGGAGAAQLPPRRLRGRRDADRADHRRLRAGEAGVACARQARPAVEAGAGEEARGAAAPADTSRDAAQSILMMLPTRAV